MKNNLFNKTFPFKHWLGTLFLGPFIADFMMKNSGKMNHQVVGMVEVYPITIVFSIVFSIPTGMLYLWWYHHLNKNKIPSNYIRRILICISIFGIITTLYFINKFNNWEIMLGYSLSSMVSAHIFSLETHATE